MCRFRERVWEARNLMLASKNLLKPADGEPIISPSKRYGVGCVLPDARTSQWYTGKEPAFASLDEVDMAFRLDRVKVETQIRLKTITWFDEKNKRLAKPEDRN
jgi:DNA-directed RNA polymerase subunit beta'